uniref:ATP synthase complex subunit 8 n=2 Tax=Drepane TaxID=75021 RepID=A0A0U1XIW8_9TELE|nr:ATP synthase F0 subunit 8 [Drepane punctata]AJW76250.1 ATP synthase F0 subunit 8 [Drepane longimana]
MLNLWLPPTLSDMPQLDPTPWCPIFIFSWYIFLTILPPKVMAHSYANEPTPKSAKPQKTEAWNWPWH